jgi:hypothetical protein
MSQDPRVQQAREHNEAASLGDQAGRRHRAERDRLVRELRRSDPAVWSYGKLAKAIGVSRELIYHICAGA